MERPWRDEIAHHLELAALAIKTRKDSLFERHVKLAIGYLEKAARGGESPNAVRLLDELNRSLNERELTAQMKFTPEEIEKLEAEAQAAPSLPPKRNAR